MIMKVLLLNNSAFTKRNNNFFCEKRTGEFAEELVKLGNQVTMFGQFIESDSKTHTYNISNSDIKIYALPATKIKILRYLKLYLSMLPKVYHSDFVYIFFPSSFKYTAFLSLILDKPYGLYVRGQKNIDSKLSLRIYKHAHAVFTVSDSFTQLIKKKSNNKKVSTIRPMINFSEIDINYHRNYLAPEFLNILYLGRIEKDKGIPELLNAIKCLKNKKTNFKLTLVGDGGYYDEMLTTIKKLGIESLVSVLGNIEDTESIKKTYSEADLFILPSHHEGFPRTLYEAMIFGTPIITTFVGGIPAIMTDHKNCIEIDVKSQSSIVEALIYAMDNYCVMIDLARNAMNTISPIINSNRPSHARGLNMILKEIINER